MGDKVLDTHAGQAKSDVVAPYAMQTAGVVIVDRS